MAFCRKCGSELTEGQLFCIKCGEPVDTMNNTTAEAQAAPEAAPAEKAKLNVGMLIWSIINMICCASILGIVALIFTILADNQPLEKANGYMRIAKILNIVATVISVLLIMLSIFVFILEFIFIISSPIYY